MARIEPISEGAAEDLWREHYGRVTNMKRTLARSPRTLQAYMEWYPLRDAVAGFLGARATNIFVHAISAATDCLICSTFFRRVLIDAGEDPDDLSLDPKEEALVDLARALVQRDVPDDLYERVRGFWDPSETVLLVGLGGMMIATNIFNDALKVDLDDYLKPYRRPE